MVVLQGPWLVAMDGGRGSRDEREGSEAPRRVTRYERFVKPVMDRAVGAVLLLAVLPTLLLVALAVRALLGRSVIFKQRRVGRGGRVFTMYKFRTMHPDRRMARLRVAPERRLTHKHPQDPRLTPLGRFLRKWSLDELPQLWNVVTGTMSLVGPRPALPTEAERYGRSTARRLLVKPGITGLWQVSGRSELGFSEQVLMDITYIENWSLGLDLRILLKTVPAVLSGKGAF